MKTIGPTGVLTTQEARTALTPGEWTRLKLQGVVVTLGVRVTHQTRSRHVHVWGSEQDIYEFVHNRTPDSWQDIRERSHLHYTPPSQQAQVQAQEEADQQQFRLRFLAM